MAEVWLARTSGDTDQLVVLKKIKEEHAHNPQWIKMFLDEAKLVSTLDHPHIARAYDHGEIDGTCYFAMEFVHGQDLASALERAEANKQHFPIGAAIYIGRAIAEALNYAHDHKAPDGSDLRLIHRDVSLSNVMISYEGDVKLVDFGVAKSTTNRRKTQAGALIGKFSYMSPEQALGKVLDRRSDVFSLGIVLWESVTGEPLFFTEDELETLRRVQRCQVTSPKERRPDCPPELERIVLKALARDPAERYQTAGELAHDLDNLAEQIGRGKSVHDVCQYMQQAFAPEIAAWHDAQEAGTTLTQYMLQSNLDATMIDPDADSVATLKSGVPPADDLEVPTVLFGGRELDQLVAVPKSIPLPLHVRATPRPERPPIPWDYPFGGRYPFGNSHRHTSPALFYGVQPITLALGMMVLALTLALVVVLATRT